MVDLVVDEGEIMSVQRYFMDCLAAFSEVAEAHLAEVLAVEGLSEAEEALAVEALVEDSKNIKKAS